MSVDLPTWFVQRFAAPRLAPYVHAARREGISAHDLYVWNVEIAAAFYIPLHVLEIAPRNSLHDRLVDRYGQQDWWTAAPLDGKARNEVLRQHGRPTADHVVAALTFGFWLSLLSKRYDRRLWVPVLHTAFPHYRRDRRTPHDHMFAMVRLRNRIMHHEPIHHRHLKKDHEKIHLLLSYLDPRLPVWLRAVDPVPAVLTRRPRATSDV